MNNTTLFMYSQIVCEVLAFFMLFMAMIISTAPTVHEMIPLYQYQSGALGLVTLVTAVAFDWNPQNTSSDPFSRAFLFVFTIIPFGLLLMVEPLLALASVPEDLSTLERIRRLVRILFAYISRPPLWLITSLRGQRRGRVGVETLPGMTSLENARHSAYPVWLARRTGLRASFLPILLDLLLIVLAFNVAYTLAQGYTPAGGDRFVPNILAISFSLLLLGLSIMRSKQDIISQIMGLLVMEHGMFLVAIRLITSPMVVIAFVVSLVLYIMITLTILVFLLPDLHRISGRIDIDQQEELKG